MQKSRLQKAFWQKVLQDRQEASVCFWKENQRQILRWTIAFVQQVMIENWTGKILISTPKMGYDSEFSNSVILLYEESAEHVAGLIVNKPTTIKTKKIFEVKGFKEIEMNDPVYSGGPVNRDSIIILHSDEWKCGNTLSLNNGFNLTSDTQMMKKFALKDKPKHFRFFNGLSLWSPGQLEGEIESKCWLVGTLTNPDLILKTPPGQQYMKAVELIGSQKMSKYL